MNTFPGYTFGELNNLPTVPTDFEEKVLAEIHFDTPAGSQGYIKTIRATETRIAVDWCSTKESVVEKDISYMPFLGRRIESIRSSLWRVWRKRCQLEFSLPANVEGAEGYFSLGRFFVQAPPNDERLLAFLQRVEDLCNEHQRRLTEFRREAAERQAIAKRDQYAFWNAYLDAKLDLKARDEQSDADQGEQEPKKG